MNQTFNLNRFSKLFAKHTADNYKTYLMSFGVLLGILFLILGFASYTNYGKLDMNQQIPFFIFILLLTGCVFTSIVFSDLGNKKRAIAILTLPASHLEKFLINWIYSFLIFQLLYIPAFYLASYTVQKLGGVEDIQYLNLFSRGEKVYIVFLIFIVLHAITFLGSVYFSKLHFIKTSLIFLIGFFILAMCNTEFMRFFVDKQVDGAFPFGQLSIKIGDEQFKRIRINPLEQHFEYIFTMLLVVAGVLWSCTFYRLKEKEV